MNRELHRSRLESLSLPDLIAEAVFALVAEHDGKDSQGRPTLSATALVRTYRSEWQRRGFTAESWMDDVIQVGRAELKARRKFNEDALKNLGGKK
jgi:hypothetical protein